MSSRGGNGPSKTEAEDSRVRRRKRREPTRNPADLHTSEDRSQAVGRFVHFQGSFESLTAGDAGHGDRSVRVTRSTTTRGGTLKNFIFHYHAPQDLEKFRSRSTTTRRRT